MDHDKAARQTQLSEQLQGVKEAADEGVSLVEDLEKRLSGLLRPTPPEAADSKTEPSQPLVPTAEFVRLIGEQVSRCNSHLRSIIDRLEA